MYKKILLKLDKNLNALPFIKKSKTNTEIIKLFLQQVDFIDNLKQIYQGNSYTCKDIFHISVDLISKFTENTLPDNWIYYV